LVISARARVAAGCRDGALVDYHRVGSPVTAVRLLKAADRRVQPWKNAGGTTAEVYIHPPGSGFDDFEWRVSIAEVTAAGPFSTFAGVDRVLTILEGELELRLADRPLPVALTTRSPPFNFAGEVPCHGKPLTKPARDLNVMTRRGEWSAIVEQLPGSAGQCTVRHDAGPAILVACTTLQVEVQNRVSLLSPLDAVLLPQGSEASLRVGAGPPIYVRLMRI
jgi:environmental stress-induced protein Ves